MLHLGKRGRALPLVGLALAGLAACGPSKEIQQQLAELQVISAEKDSLVTQVAANTRLMSDISAELAKVQVPVSQAGTAESQGLADPDAILSNIRTLTARVEDSEGRLVESQKRIDALSRTSTTQKTQLANFQKTIDEFRGTIESQKQTIASLTEQVGYLQQENARLAAVNVTLADTVSAITNRENSVWYVVGTKQELLDRGIINEEGGSRVLFIFGKRGKTLVPAPNLDLSTFNVADQRYLSEIPLPDTTGEYQVVTRQDLTALETPPDDEGRLTGREAIHIADPSRFWSNDRVLIIVRSS
ncbi:MAG: hypothetical protein PVH00_11655 [Gemmatimonadota bacterium]|jgi:hypothetical protein